MTERPILFSGAMIRAILEGRKTQTRRPVKPQSAGVAAPAPFGESGDRLWVRETWCLAHPDYHSEEEGERLGRPLRNGRWCHYAASDDVSCNDGRSPWRPSIHMPRWASRITLEVIGVRVERLQDIDEEGALREGVYGAINARVEFKSLWETLYCAKAPWASNPWVWVVAFQRAEAIR